MLIAMPHKSIMQVYIIGGDGTQKGAAVIYEVILHLDWKIIYLCVSA